MLRLIFTFMSVEWCFEMELCSAYSNEDRLKVMAKKKLLCRTLGNMGCIEQLLHYLNAKKHSWLCLKCCIRSKSQFYLLDLLCMVNKWTRLFNVSPFFFFTLKSSKAQRKFSDFGEGSYGNRQNKATRKKTSAHTQR